MNISFQGLKYDKALSKVYREAINANPEISEKAAQKYNIKVSIRDAFCKEDNDAWRILKFRIKEKGLIKGIVDHYITVVSSKMSDKEIVDGISKLKTADFDKAVRS